jgi:hypothetical protein
MATLSSANPTFLDLAKAMNPDGSVMQVAEVLNEMNNGILEYMTFTEGNLPTGHRFGIRTGLPTATWGRLYKGVQPSKGNIVQVTANAGMIESLSEIDARLVELAANPMEYRFIEDRPHVEAMHQAFFDTLFYGDESLNPERFTGLTAHYNSLSAANSDNILNAGGGADTDLHSIWLVVWSPSTLFGIVPRNSQAGLQQEDRGKVWLENADGNNGRMKVYSTYFRMDAGLCVRDWRYAVRIANVDLSETLDDASSGPVLYDLMKDAIERIPDFNGRAGYYMNRSLRQKLRKQMAKGVANSTLTMEDLGGVSPRKELHFDGIPVFRCDALAGGETVVS